MTTDNKYLKETLSTRDELLKNKRVDSLDEKTIRSLNHVESEDMFAKAHQGNVPVLKTYDAVNGMVYNAKDRQLIIRKLVDRMPTGQETNYKLASIELAKTLAKVGDKLEQDGNKLYRVADNCLQILEEKQATIKVASTEGAVGSVGLGLGTAGVVGLAGASPWLLTAIPIAAGLFYWSQNSGAPIETVPANGKVVIDDIELLLHSGEGYLDDTYDATFLDQLKRIEADVRLLSAKAARIADLKRRIVLTYDYQEALKKDRKLASDVKVVGVLLKQFNDAVVVRLRNIADKAAFLSNKSERESVIKSRSTLSEWTHNLNNLSGGVGDVVLGDRLKKLGLDLGSFKAACEGFITSFQAFQTTVAQMTQQVQNQVSDGTQTEAEKKEEAAARGDTPSTPGATPAPSNGEVPQTQNLLHGLGANAPKV
jgi:hypothetical protein